MQEIEIGQRYQKADAQFIVWQVAKLVPDPDNILHARLVRVGDPTQVKVVSTVALRDRSMFCRMRDETLSRA